MAKIETDSGIPDDSFLREGLIDRLSQYVEAEPGAWHVRYNLAVALMHDGMVDEALEQFKQVLQYAPKHMESLVNIGGIHLSRGESGEALKVFTTALAVWDVPVVRSNLAVAYMQLGRWKEAEGEFRRVLDMDSKLPDVWTNLGWVLLRGGRVDESVEACQKALELREDFAMAHNNLAVALLEKGDGDQARTHADRARELGYPVAPEILEELGLS